MPEVPDEAVRLALAARAHALADRPTPTALSDEALTREMPEAAAPATERDIRTRIAASLRRAAAGRREYAATYARYRDGFLAEADCYESAARIAEDPLNILDVIPARQWTDEESASLRKGAHRGD